jgi:hypothetical protein
MKYHDFEVEATGSVATSDGGRTGKYQVRVLRTTNVGEMSPDQAVPVEYDDIELQHSLDLLEQRDLDEAGLIKLGRTLAAILLPTSASDSRRGVRELFAKSLARIPSNEGIRLRLRLPYELSVIPWEYMFIERAGGEGIDGFLALDPRVGIVRHEALAVAADLLPLTGDLKVVTALSAPTNLPKLDLALEQRVLAESFKGLNLAVVPCLDATMAKLQPLLPGAGVFHFAGHGDFAKKIGLRPGTYSGHGFLAFADESVDPAQFAINLRGNGVRLAVLAACQTGRRDGFNVWSGIAPALVKAEIPAVVANQFRIKDTTAIAFSQHFYQALAAGLPIERAMTAGRIGAYNRDKSGRDWGVPVLYLRAAEGRLFEGPSNAVEREQRQEGAEADIRVRVREVKAGAIVVGASLGRMLGGRLAVNVTIPGSVLGKVVGATVDQAEGGSLNVDANIDTVATGGSLVAAVINTLEGVKRRRTRGLKRRRGTEGAGTSSTVSVRDNKGQAIGTQINYNYVQGPPPALTDTRPPTANLIEEAIRLDVALPSAVTVDETFSVVIAVRQPEAPPLSESDLPQVVSAAGSIFREEADAVVSYRIELAGSGFRVEPKQYTVKLRPKQNSVPVAFQVTSSRSGVRTLIVTAYQADDAVAAQTRLNIDVKVAVSGVS